MFESTQNPAVGDHAPTPSVDLSLADTMRVMDFATTLRREQIEVHKQFNLDETKRLLREKLLQTAEVTGEQLSPTEIDAAIGQYFDNLHAYEDPKFGPRVFLAYVWVRRGLVAGICGAVLVLALIVAGATTLASARSALRAENMWLTVFHNQRAIAAATDDGLLLEQAQTQEQKAAQARTNRDFVTLESLVAASTALREQLEAEYEVRVISQQGEQSAVDRYFEDETGKRVSGYYLIVEARNPDGSRREIKVRNRESGSEEVVSRWAEQVPKEVYDRLAQDKRQDGVLDETLFAKKARGEMDSAIVMIGADGKPLPRGGQITTW